VEGTKNSAQYDKMGMLELSNNLGGSPKDRNKISNIILHAKRESLNFHFNIKLIQGYMQGDVVDIKLQRKSGNVIEKYTM